MLIGKRIRLRAIERDDLPLMVTWRNDVKNYQHFFEHEPLSLVMQEQWFDSFLKRDDEKLWIIETDEKSKPIGTVGIAHIDWRSRKAEWGRLLIHPEKYRHGGYGSEIESIVLRYVFEHMNLHKLYCEVFAENENVIKLHKKFGFLEEGRFRQHVFKNGQYRDVVFLALLKESYLKKSKAVIKKYLEL